MLTSSAILSDASADNLLPTEGVDNSMIIESFAFGFLSSTCNFGEDENSGSTAVCSNFPLEICHHITSVFQQNKRFTLMIQLIQYYHCQFHFDIAVLMAEIAWRRENQPIEIVMSEMLTKRPDQRSIGNLVRPSLEIQFYVDSTLVRQYMRALYFLHFRNQLPTIKKAKSITRFWMVATS